MKRIASETVEGTKAAVLVAFLVAVAAFYIVAKASGSVGTAVLAAVGSFFFVVGGVLVCVAGGCLIEWACDKWNDYAAECERRAWTEWYQGKGKRPL